MKKNNKGIALIIALILSFIALALVGTTLLLIRHSINISGSFTSYQTALEAAKGGVDASMAFIIKEGSSLSESNNYTTIDLSNYIPSSKLGEYNITSKLLKKFCYDVINHEQNDYDTYCTYSIEVISSSTVSKSKAIIDVILKKEE